MRITIKNVDKLVEAIRLASRYWKGDLGNAGAVRIERDIRNAIEANMVKKREATK